MFTDVADPAGTGTTPRGVSGNTIIGYYINSSGVEVGFDDVGGTYIDIIDPTPGVKGTFPLGISGTTVVGYYKDSSNHQHGFIFDGHTYTTVDDPDPAANYGTVLTGISGGNYVGYYLSEAQNGTISNGALAYNGSTFTDLTFPIVDLQISAQASSVSDQLVVGNYTSLNSVTHGFILGQNVSFGSVVGTIVSDNGSQIVATAPAGTAGASVDVTMATTAGLSTPSATDKYTYVATVPEVTSISPSSGTVAGGTTVTITGTNLGGATAVTFGGTAATILSDSATQLVVTDPAGAAGTVDVVVTTSGGTSQAETADKFTYQSAAPYVTSINPSVGPTAGGTTVTLTGTGLAGATAVTFGGTSATIVSDSASQIVVTTPPGAAGIADVLVTTSAGTSAGSPAYAFVYTAPTGPTVASVSPSSGPAAGGTTITIAGTNLGGATAVTFGGTTATILSDSATQLVVTDPAGATGTVDVVVTTQAGSSQTGATDKFTYQAPLPVVTGVSPGSGPATGGITVTLTGTDLDAATTVDFNSTPATIVSGTATQLVVTVPAGTAGNAAYVTVTTPAGTSAVTSADYFTYTAPAPVITGVSPSLGTAGTTVTVTGLYLNGAVGVQFGALGNLGTATILSDTATQIVVTAPTESPGTVDIRVENSLAISAVTQADQYTYAGVPNVTVVSPANGPASGGNSVTLTGTDLGGASAVYFGGTPGTIVSDSATQLVATAPAGTAGSGLFVTVTTPGGTSGDFASAMYTYQTATSPPAPAPTVTGISPSSGSTVGGTLVTIAGTGLGNATAVAFGGTAGTIVSDSATQIVAAAPAGAAGTVFVTVTTPGGTSGDLAAAAYTYQTATSPPAPAPTVTGISPSFGSTAGGILVTITGTDLGNATAVAFGGIGGTIVSDNATQVVAIAPAGTAGPVDVTVFTAAGTSATGPNQFTYVSPPPAAPSVTGISPSSGSTAGGTLVTIIGTDLGNATAVAFGGIGGTIVSDSATQIMATAPAGAAGAVNVTVFTAAGTSATGPDPFTYVSPPPMAPTVAGISPSSGSTVGGTLVTIAGTGLGNATAVAFGGTAGTIVSDSATQIVAAAPAGAAGTVFVTVTTPGGTSGDLAAAAYTYQTATSPPAPAPTVTGISPSFGSTAGGILVTITGTDLGNATAVAFGGIGGTIVSDNATQVVAIAPAGTAGPVDVTVFTAAGTSATGPNQFTYVSPPPAAPSVTGISPSSGSTAGGTLVTIIGTDLGNATAVAFGGIGGTIVSDSATQIMATAPAGAAGAVNVTVFTAAGTSATGLDPFTYVSPPPTAPTVAGVSPSSGSAAGGTLVTITGAGLANATAVAFGGTAGTIVSDTLTQIVATAPAGVAGTVDVAVTTAGGTSATSTADQFTYLIMVSPPPPAPAVTGISPSSGPTAGGTLVTITGSGLANATVVAFGGAAGTIVSDTATQIVAAAPAGATGTVDVAVFTAGGTSAASTADHFTYTAPPVSRPPSSVLVGASQFAVGADAGGVPLVESFNANQTPVLGATSAFASSFTGGARVVAADFNNDGVADIAVGTGPGGPNEVTILDGKTGAVITTFQPFEASFTGGIFVAAGDITGDGIPDLIVTPDQTGGPVVAVYDGTKLVEGLASGQPNGQPAQINRFFGIQDPNFRGGARAAAGDINGDGVADIVVSAGFSGGPRIAGFDGKSVASGVADPTKLFADFFAFEPSLTNGAYVAVGDINGDGHADVIAGGGPGGGPRVTVFDGAALLSNTQTPVADFFAGDPSNRGGVRVAVKDLDGTADAGLVVGSGTGAGATVTGYTGKAILADPGSPTSLFSLDAFPGFTGGVFVG
ncbi:Flagellar hook-length control protein FliK [Fimbriiglobus ruber]|uniref:Flagellar hook-length control protein FliK n=1 Tax=Fimbriiglobus ruber TaxID=1908690 RepID=A0A225DUS4_9BACT|nr:Flagellar hook-length control protein FliK [Fimbriiglobus ruber]